MQYEIVRHTICGDDREMEDLDYFTSRREAEKIARELTEIYAVDDGHPWSGDKFYAHEISEQTIREREYRCAMSRAFAEMGGEY